MHPRQQCKSGSCSCEGALLNNPRVLHSKRRLDASTQCLFSLVIGGRGFSHWLQRRVITEMEENAVHVPVENTSFECLSHGRAYGEAERTVARRFRSNSDRRCCLFRHSTWAPTTVPWIRMLMSSSALSTFPLVS